LTLACGKAVQQVFHLVALKVKVCWCTPGLLDSLGLSQAASAGTDITHVEAKLLWRFSVESSKAAVVVPAVNAATEVTSCERNDNVPTMTAAPSLGLLSFTVL
jgi:hypothetical protein